MLVFVFVLVFFGSFAEKVPRLPERSPSAALTTLCLVRINQLIMPTNCDNLNKGCLLNTV